MRNFLVLYFHREHWDFIENEIFWSTNESRFPSRSKIISFRYNKISFMRISCEEREELDGHRVHFCFKEPWFRFNEYTNNRYRMPFKWNTAEKLNIEFKISTHRSPLSSSPWIVRNKWWKFCWSMFETPESQIKGKRYKFSNCLPLICDTRQPEPSWI